MTAAGERPARALRALDPLAFLDAEIEDLKAKGLFRRLRVVQGEQRSRCLIDGREVITLSSNNYLGLNTHPHLREAASTRCSATAPARARCAPSRGR